MIIFGNYLKWFISKSLHVFLLKYLNCPWNLSRPAGQLEMGKSKIKAKEAVTVASSPPAS